VADPRASWLLADILSDNSARVPRFGTDSPLRFDFPVACKTGTSTDYRDNWSMAYTPEFTVGVWVGNFNGSPMRGVSGVTGAAPLMHEVMDHLHNRFGTSWYATPPNVVESIIDPATGKLVTSRRADLLRETFLEENVPPLESSGDYDAAGRTILAPVYSEWLAGTGHSLEGRFVIENEPGKLQIVAPVPGTTFVIDPDLPGSRRAKLSVQGSIGIDWTSESLDCANGESMLTEGEHRLVAVDRNTGARAETWIRVKSL
jgi:penicillin-binding protein 1C